MNQIRSNLTRLIKKIEESLPDGADIFGYPGVERQAITEYLGRAYDLTNRILELRNQFPLTALKRSVLPLIAECKRYLEEDVRGKHPEKKFDEFLKSVTRIHDEIFLAYVIHFSESIRKESELENLIHQINTASEAYLKHRDSVVEVANSLEQIRLLKESTEGSGEIIASAEVSIQATNQKILDLLTEADANSQVITKYEAEAKTQKEAIINLMAEMKGNEEKLAKSSESAERKLKAIESVFQNAKVLHEKNQKNASEIADTIRAASRYGMASSFKQRKDELRLSLLMWAIMFVMAILGIFCTGVFYILPHFEGGELPKVWEVLVKATLISPLVWLGWMAARQYSFISRIREDYSFKYASALAFEGYKSEALKVDKDFVKQLLSTATANMALNPLRIYQDESSSHVTPVSEAIAKFRSNPAEKADEEG